MIERPFLMFLHCFIQYWGSAIIMRIERINNLSFTQNDFSFTRVKVTFNIKTPIIYFLYHLFFLYHLIITRGYLMYIFS